MATGTPSSGAPSGPARVVVFGAAGHLGQELLSVLERAPFEVSEILGVVSEGSEESEFEFRGEAWAALSKWPVLRPGDLVFICTPSDPASEVIRAALRAEAPCIDCSGVLAGQEGVLSPLWLGDGEAGDTALEEKLKSAPLVSLPSAALLAWAPLLAALSAEPGLERVAATVLSAASGLGRDGLLALSEESIALFNQGDASLAGPAGQPVAFDVIPGGPLSERLPREAAALLGASLRLDVAHCLVPAFIGESASLALELATPLTEDALRARLAAVPGLDLVKEGLGSRGLVAVEAAPSEGGARVPSSPTLRDGAGSDAVRAGRIEADRSLPEGRGWRLWLSYDPARLMAEQAVRAAAERFRDS